MCRASNAFGIRYSHMRWMDDSLCIYFAHSKTDQLGERPRDPRHVYPNPLKPSICPILALGLYFVAASFDRGSNSLFPGSNQYDRYRKSLSRLTNTPNVASVLAANGLKPDDIGSHSGRKGAATYASSGSTCAPSSVAIHLRAGWARGGVQDTYLR